MTRRMHLRRGGLLLAAGAALFIGTTSASAEPPAKKSDGATLFQEYKCTKCHSAPGIKGGDKKDLAGVGTRHDAAWFKKFLLKEVELDGKKHKKSFTGSDAELEVLAKWLESLKK